MHQVFVSKSGRFDIQVKEQFLNLPYRRNATKPAMVRMEREAKAAAPNLVRRAMLFRVGEIPSVNIARPQAVKKAGNAPGMKNRSC